MKWGIAVVGLATTGVALAVAVTMHLAQSPASSSQSTEPERFIVDVDHAMDDMFALALALRSPELKVVGITMTPHPEVAPQARFVARLLRELGQDNIPIVFGKSLLTNSCRCGHWDTISHTLGVDYPAPIAESAAEFIVRQASATPGKVSVLTFGPLTNLADALARDPDVAQKVSRVVMLAGNGRHVTDHCAEYNVATDVAAAQRVLASGIPVLMVGVDISGRAMLSPDVLKRALAGQDGFSQVLRIYWEANGAKGFWPHDLLAVFAAVTEDAFSWAIGAGALADNGCLSFSRSGEGAIGLATTVDTAAFRRFASEGLAGHAATRGVRPAVAEAQPAVERAAPEKVIVDLEYITDDFFALAVALQSPELDVVGVTLVPHTEATNEVRAVAALLHAAGRDDIPLAIAKPTPYQQWHGNKWTAADEKGLEQGRPSQLLNESAPDFIIQTIRSAPGQISLITIGMQSNLGEALRRDPFIAGKVKRVVMMGGSIAKDYQFREQPASREHNVSDDVGDVQAVLASGIPVLMVGLDATANLRFDLANLYRLATDAPSASRFLRTRFGDHPEVITPYDVMAVAMATDRSFCERRRGHVEITAAGHTQLVSEMPDNVEYCVNPDVKAFNAFFFSRLGVLLTETARR